MNSEEDKEDVQSDSNENFEIKSSKITEKSKNNFEVMWTDSQMSSMESCLEN